MVRTLTWLLFLAFLPLPASAFTLDWSGLYRVEGLQITNSELDGIDRRKSYIHHHLILEPKIHAADGLTVFSRLNIFNSGDVPNSQFGQFFGSGIGSSGGDSSDTSNTLSNAQSDETVLASQLYLSYDAEFMNILVGRAPLQFGLGMNHHAGAGKFDHWYDTRDLIAAKLSFGNLAVTPMIGKVYEGELDVGDDIWEYIIRLDYENFETETAFGLFWQWRRSGRAGNDSAPAFNSTLEGGFEGDSINLYLKRGWGDLQIGLEGGFSRGGTGTNDADGDEVSMDGLGLALEVDYAPKGSNWSYDLMAGYVGGDDPNTTNKFEGYFFDRNYDVGLLLFNHVLGQYDVLSSTQARGINLSGNDPSLDFDNAGSNPDVEVVSNAIYFAPGFEHQWNDDWAWGGRFIYAFLQEDNVLVNSSVEKVDADLGFELDFHLKFQPHDKFTWVNEVGFLLPGGAFEGGSAGFESEFAYGMTTRAAISF